MSHSFTTCVAVSMVVAIAGCAGCASSSSGRTDAVSTGNTTLTMADIEDRAPKPAVPSTTTTLASEVNVSPGEPLTRVRHDMLPAGLGIAIRTIDPISSEDALVGSRFAAELVTAIVANDADVIIPAGAKVYGEVITAQDGRPSASPNTNPSARARLMLTVTDVQTGPRFVRVSTTTAGAQSDGAGGLRPIGAGRLIGMPDEGATGANVSLATGDRIVIRPGTLVELELTQSSFLAHPY